MRYIYCHPLLDERKCAHRFSFQLRNTFQAAGLTLERFDYRGTGEAVGEFADVSLETLREDIATWADSDEVSLIGLRFGASLAFDYCARSMWPVRNLVLLEPIINGVEYLGYLYRKQRIKNLMTGKVFSGLPDKGYVNLEGYKTSVKFVEQIKNFHLVEIARKSPIESSVYVVQVSKQLLDNPEVTCLAKLLERSARQVLIESVGLCVFWERIPSADYSKLTQKVLEWCYG